MVYYPSRPASIADIESLWRYIDEELNLISREFSEMSTVELRPSNVAPAKPREGMLVYADGTNWNPGGGAGVYVYSGGTWVKL